jgi:hypothetical protein
MFCCYVLPNGAITFRHERGPIRRLGGAIRIATGDPNHMPRQVLAIAERDEAVWYVPGARGQKGGPFLGAVARFIARLAYPEAVAA